MAASTHKIYIVQDDHTIKLEERPIPTISEGEILVKIEAVALNPTDWKHRDDWGKPGTGLGCDFSGVIVQGEDSHVKKGDRVAGFVHGGNKADHGAFAEYVATKASLVWKVPESTSAEEAAALGGIAPDTAVLALYLRHKLPQPDQPIADKQPFIVWGGSSSVGLYAIQLAKLSGYTVIATASPKNHELVKSFGATAVYDYSDEQTSAKIAEAYPDLHLGMDCVSEKGTTALIAKSFSKKEGCIVTILPVKDETLDKEFPRVSHDFILVQTVLGQYFEFGQYKLEVNDGDFKGIQDWKVKVSKLIADGKLKSNPLWSQKGGLESINEGLELLKAGKNSAQKVTYKF